MRSRRIALLKLERIGMTGRKYRVVEGQGGRELLFVLLMVVLVCWSRPIWGEEPSSGAALLASRCSMCHAAQKSGKLEPIESERKTPEGWEMTIDRMVRMQGVRLQSQEGYALVKYLSDRYGLAPAEVEPFRYALEKRNSTVVQPDLPKLVQGSCVQCHSYARIALQ